MQASCSSQLVLVEEELHMERAVCRNSNWIKLMRYGKALVWQFLSLLWMMAPHSHAVTMFRIDSGWVLGKVYSLEGKGMCRRKGSGQLNKLLEFKKQVDNALRCVRDVIVVWSCVEP